jgi:hypothetical protein
MSLAFSQNILTFPLLILLYTSSVVGFSQICLDRLIVLNADGKDNDS